MTADPQCPTPAKARRRRLSPAATADARRFRTCPVLGRPGVLRGHSTPQRGGRLLPPGRDCPGVLDGGVEIELGPFGVGDRILLAEDGHEGGERLIAQALLKRRW